MVCEAAAAWSKAFARPQFLCTFDPVQRPYGRAYYAQQLVIIHPCQHVVMVKQVLLQQGNSSCVVGLPQTMADRSLLECVPCGADPDSYGFI